MHWTQLLSDRRLGADRAERPQSRGWARSDFERDYDRLVFSPAFRRLQNKTQVFPLPGNIFVHNRLTHSLEVSCLGRSLGNIVGEVLSERYPTNRETPFRSGISAIRQRCVSGTRYGESALRAQRGACYQRLLR